MLNEYVLPGLQILSFGVTALVFAFIAPLREAIKEGSRQYEALQKEAQERDEKILDEMRSHEKRLTGEMHAFQLKVAESYVKRSELDTKLTIIMGKLDTIDSRLSTKVEQLDHGKQDKP